MLWLVSTSTIPLQSGLHIFSKQLELSSNSTQLEQPEISASIPLLIAMAFATDLFLCKIKKNLSQNGIE